MKPKPTNTTSTVAFFNTQASIHFKNPTLHIVTSKLNGRNFMEWSQFEKKKIFEKQREIQIHY